MDDDNAARKRLLLYTALRFCGALFFFLGVAIMYTNIVRPGGWPQLGAIIAIVGVVDAFIVPRLVKRAWDRQDQQGP